MKSPWPKIEREIDVTDRALTYGERLVTVSFNPSGDERVRRTKEAFAAVIDAMNELRSCNADQEHKLLCTVAIQAALTAQMWAVKCITWRSPS